MCADSDESAAAQSAFTSPWKRGYSKSRLGELIINGVVSPETSTLSLYSFTKGMSVSSRAALSRVCMCLLLLFCFFLV